MNNIDKQDIKHFWVAGINYKKTDASLRGLFAVTEMQLPELQPQLAAYGVKEMFILSTCNRTEIYGFAESARYLADLLCSVCAGDADTFTSLSYTKNGQHAVEHLFEVGAGLDSQILGDYEILGQIKNAAKCAKAYGFMGPFTERLVNSVLQASKAIKTHTVLSSGTVSVAFAAVQYIREYFEGPVFTPEMKCPASEHILTEATTEHYTKETQVKDKKIVLVGTGKIGKSACRNLVDYLCTNNITLINRTEETARALAAELNLKHAPIAALESEIADADVVLVSVNATEAVILEKHLAGKGDKLVIDFSIPCNVTLAAQQLPNVRYVDVDQLSKIKDETLSLRRSEIPKAIAIIGELVADFMEWYDMRKHVPVLKKVKSKLKEIPADNDAMNGEIAGADKNEKIQKVINSLAVKMRKDNTLGCHYIQAINEFIG